MPLVPWNARTVAAYLLILAGVFLTLIVVEAAVGPLDFWASLALVVVASFFFTAVVRMTSLLET